METIIVLAGGDGARPAGPLPDAACVIAADSGLHLAAPLGLTVDLVVGDMDSVDPGVLQAAVASGAAVDRHPRDKDASDLELALAAAMARHPDRIVVVGGAGGRLDHLLANAALVATTPVPLTWLAGPFTLTPVRHHTEIHGAAGDLVSIIPWDSRVIVSTTGLRWSLTNEELNAGSTRSLSNEMTADLATVDVRDGVALVIHRTTP